MPADAHAPTLGHDELVAAGRNPPCPFRIVLADGTPLRVLRALRVLPGQRITGEAEWQGQRVLAKLFLTSAANAHCRREATGARLLAAAGVPTPALLGSFRSADGVEALLFDFLDGASTLAERLAQSDAPGARQHGDPGLPLAPAFRLLGTLHAAGLVHADLHPGNLLEHRGQWLLIDSDAVATPPAARAADALQDNLALFLAQFPPRFTPAPDDALQAYRSTFPGSAISTEELAARVEHARRTRLHRFLAKVGRDCSRFMVERSASRFMALLRSEASWLREFTEQPDRWLHSGTQLKGGRTATVARVSAGTRDCVIKRYNIKGLAHALGRAWRPSRAWHSWREAHRLAFLGIATPAALAIIERRLGPLRRQAWLITEFCPGISLRELFAGRENETPTAAEAKALLDLFGRLHAQRITHGDLKDSNLLWHEGRISLIDLDATVQHRSERSYLAAWRRDRARWLRNWPADSALCQWFAHHLPPAEHASAMPQPDSRSTSPADSRQRS